MPTNQSGGAATGIAAQGFNPGSKTYRKKEKNGGAVARLFAEGKRSSGYHPVPDKSGPPLPREE